jgi:hypothetical protein
MQTNFKKIILGTSLLLLILSLGWGKSYATSAQPAALVRINIPSDAHFTRFSELGIPIFSQLWDDEGKTYLLALVDIKDQTLINDIDVRTQILDTDSTGAAYFLISSTHNRNQDQLDLNILLKTSQYQIVRIDLEGARNFQPEGFDIQRLTLHPFVHVDGGSTFTKQTSITPNPHVQAMIDQVSVDSVYDYVGGLSGEWQIQINGNPYTLHSRYSYAADHIKKATKYVYDHLTGLGLATDFEDYNVGGVWLRNVIADQPGANNPECLVLLVGHLDSISYENPEYDAPGADDNASGSTGVLVAADILHQYQFACTIRYVLFTGEEQGMFGSQDYASIVFNNDDNIIAVVNLDMIGYNSDNSEVIGVHTRPGNTGDLAIANTFVDVVQAYNINLTPEIVQDGERFSDHASFWDYGYSAILTIEDFDDFTPEYHLISDTIDTLNFSYLGDNIRAAVGTVAHIAGHIPPKTTFLPLLIKYGLNGRGLPANI